MKPQLQLTSAEFEDIRQYLSGNSGLDLAENRRLQLSLVVSNRVRELMLGSVKQYLIYLQQHPLRVQELQTLINELTITETYFFRNQAQFDVLQDYVLPEIFRTKAEKKLKIWCAGCSSGEEPYSIAIILNELKNHLQGWEIEIIGSDVNSAILERARAGIYHEYSVKMTNPYYLGKYFTKVNERYYIKDHIKKMVNFQYFNLIKEPYPLESMKDFDVIFCRNVTIYFKINSTIRVIRNFYNSLRWGGYFFIGYSESLYNINSDFTLMEKGETFFYSKLDPQAKNPAYDSSIEYFSLPETPKPIPPPTPLDPQVILAQGRNFLAAGDYEKAINCFNALIKEHPYLEEPYLYRGQIYAGKGFYQEALKQYTQALALKPLNAEINFLIGLVYWEKDSFAEAVEYFKKAKYLDPDFCLSYYYLGLWYEKEALKEKAFTEFKAALKVLHKNPTQIEKPIFAGFLTQIIEQSCAEKIKALEERK